MDAIARNRTFLFDHIERALREGRYLPGEWIDPVALAREFNTSVMPVQHALHQLAGADLIVMHPCGDFHVPMLFEPRLEERYHWMKSLLLEAIDRGDTAPPAVELPAVPDPQDTPNAAWRLFDAIANATASAHLNTALKRTNDQLAPVRHAKQACSTTPTTKWPRCTGIGQRGISRHSKPACAPTIVDAWRWCRRSCCIWGRRPRALADGRRQARG